MDYKVRFLEQDNTENECILQTDIPQHIVPYLLQYKPHCKSLISITRMEDRQ